VPVTVWMRAPGRKCARPYQRWMSPKDAYAYNAKREKERQDSIRRCPVCSSNITGMQRRYCSDACMREASSRRRKVRHCQMCNASWQGFIGRKYCEACLRACKAQYILRVRPKPRPKTIAFGTCAVCQTKFQQVRASKPATCCSRRCRALLFHRRRGTDMASRR
jgi:predicted nucleic acid-binding Zn ribbon protein